MRAVANSDLTDLRAMAEAFHSETDNPINAEAEAAALILSLAETRRAWLAIDRGVTVGYVAVALLMDTTGSLDAEVEELYAVPGQHRRIAAACILDEPGRELAPQGAQRLFVAFAPSHQVACCYFQRHGFVTDPPGLAVRKLR